MAGKPTLSINQLGMKLDTEENGRLISNMIDAVKVIECLILSGNTLGVDASRVIAQSLSRQPTLKQAIFADMFTGRLKTEIPQVLKNLSDAMTQAGVQLEELDLSDNAIGPMAMPGIEQFLASRPCFSLRKLYFNNCGLGQAGVTLAHQLIQCKRNALAAGASFELKTFIAGRNRQEDNGAKALSQMFKELGTLERIELPQNGIRPDGIVALANALRHCRRLRFLNINDNTATRHGAHALAEAFAQMELLEHVDIGDCLCRSGTVAIVQALVDTCLDLKFVDLTGNELTPDLAEEIIDIFTGADHLHQLSLVKLGLNCYGGEFERLTRVADEFGFFDFGDEDDDQGSIDGESDDDEDNNGDLN